VVIASYFLNKATYSLEQGVALAGCLPCFSKHKYWKTFRFQCNLFLMQFFTDTAIIMKWKVKRLFSALWDAGYAWTILLICCAMVLWYNGWGIGALPGIINPLLSSKCRVFGSVASTVRSVIGTKANCQRSISSHRYPVKMSRSLSMIRGLAPEKFERTFKDLREL